MSEQRRDGQGREEEGQVGDGHVEQAHRLDLLAALGAGGHPVGLGDEPGAEQNRRDQVHQADVGHGGDGEGDRDHQVGVGQDAAGDDLERGHHGEHRDAGGGVVVLEADRQRPEVRRRPEEHDREEQHGGPADRAGHGGPADQHREAARGAADDDVRRGASLEAERVDEDVEGDGPDGQHGRRPVDQQAEHEGRDDAEGDAETQRLGGFDDLPDERAAFRAAHELVDVAVDVAVDRVGAAGGEGAGEQRHRDQPPGRHPALGEEHDRHRGDEEQLHDPQFHQRYVGPGPVGRPGQSAPGNDQDITGRLRPGGRRRGYRDGGYRDGGGGHGNTRRLTRARGGNGPRGRSRRGRTATARRHRAAGQALPVANNGLGRQNDLAIGAVIQRTARDGARERAWVVFYDVSESSCREPGSARGLRPDGVRTPRVGAVHRGRRACCAQAARVAATRGRGLVTSAAAAGRRRLPRRTAAGQRKASVLRHVPGVPLGHGHWGEDHACG
ncbi:hypothetical protein FRAHR75_50151 [Frankia sp. Hr75.2]|nr:hypothetical protein FRAHR75_50151 [Frankia sp. Hr75.2]